MNEISIDDFLKLDIRICKILKAEKVEGADKLLKLTLDEGEGKERTIVSGIALSYPDPELLVGKLIPVIINLIPRELKGVISNGMLMAASNAEGLPVLLSPTTEVAPGTKVK